MPTVSMNRHDMHYEVHGEGDPVLCSGGWGTFCHGTARHLRTGLAERYSVVIFDHRGLADDLGIPVIPCVARNGDGIADLLKAVREVATGAYTCHPRKLRLKVPGLPEAVQEVSDSIRSAYPSVPNPDWIALQLLDGDATFLEAVANGTLGELAEDPHATLVSTGS